jgi:hypothetical protein
MICAAEHHQNSELKGGMLSHVCGLEENHEGDHQCSAFASCEVSWPNLYHGGKSVEPLSLLDEGGKSVWEPTLVEQIHTLIDEHGLVCVIDVLNEYCKKMEDNASELANTLNPWGLSPKKRWRAARVHIEHCSNLVEMIGL